MKNLILCLFTLLSMTLHSQDTRGVLKGKLYIDSIANISLDTFDIVIYQSLNKNEISKTSESQYMKIVLPPGMYSVICSDKNGKYIKFENVKVSMSKISFLDINVSLLKEQKEDGEKIENNSE